MIKAGRRHGSTLIGCYFVNKPRVDPWKKIICYIIVYFRYRATLLSSPLKVLSSLAKETAYIWIRKVPVIHFWRRQTDYCPSNKQQTIRI